MAKCAYAFTVQRLGDDDDYDTTLDHGFVYADSYTAAVKEVENNYSEDAIIDMYVRALENGSLMFVSKETFDKIISQ